MEPPPFRLLIGVLLLYLLFSVALFWGIAHHLRAGSSLEAVRRFDHRLTLGVIALVGGAFVAYLAYGSLRVQGLAASGEGGPSRSLLKGVVMNFANPHPYVFWMTIGGPTTLKAIEAGPLAPVAFIAAHYVCLVGAKVLVAMLVERGRRLLDRGYVWTIRALGVALAVFAVLFVRGGLRYSGAL